MRLIIILKAPSNEYLSYWCNRLFAYNRNVDEFNNQKLDSLSSPPVEFICEESGIHLFHVS